MGWDRIRDGMGWHGIGWDGMTFAVNVRVREPTARSEQNSFIQTNPTQYVQ
jgi:hypothetical protein